MLKLRESLEKRKKMKATSNENKIFPRPSSHLHCHVTSMLCAGASSSQTFNIEVKVDCLVICRNRLLNYNI